MVKRRTNDALTYLRRSSDRQELSLPAQLQWALDQAAKLGVRLDATLADLEYMQKHKLHAYKSIRLDDAVTGADLNRPGFLALIHDLEGSHYWGAFIYRRDRFARPEEAIEMVAIEKRLRQAGATFVFCDKIAGPSDRGQANLADDLATIFEYYESGEFLRKHAERVIMAHRQLALQGYWNGGNAPYGFVRVLVDAQGNVLEELRAGKKVRQAGCHVRIMPKDENKLQVWLYILELKDKAWGGKRIAAELNRLGIPSPGAGTIRTDQGARHLVSGKWCGRTVLELCKNRAILGVLDYGRRSEGAHRRLGADGPRNLTDADRTEEGLRMVYNDDSVVISAKTGFESQFDPEKWQRINEATKQRGESQCGIPRAHDVAKYPLSCRVVDLTDGCGSIMYGRTSGKRRLYVCGRYNRTSGAECENNSVDAEALLRLSLATLRQVIDLSGSRERLRQLLVERARQGVNAQEIDAARQMENWLVTRRNELVDDLAVAKRRMAVEKNDARYEAIAEEFDQLEAELKDAERKLEERRATPSATRSWEAEVEAAMSLFDDMTKIAVDETARSQIQPLLGKIGFRIGLRFGAGIKGKTRAVRQLLGGMIVFSDTDLPVPIHGSSRVADDREKTGAHAGVASIENEKDGQGATEMAADGGCTPPTATPRPCGSPREGVSFTKVSRGDRIPIELFLKGTRALALETPINELLMVRAVVGRTAGGA